VRLAFARFKLTGAEPCRFWQADFHSCRVKALANTTVCAAGFALPEQKSALPKLHSTCQQAIFRGFLAFFDAGGLAPIKERKTKSSEKGR